MIGEPRLDKEVELKTITESVKTRIVIIPVIAYPSPVLSRMAWLGPDNDNNLFYIFRA